jgi:hypothetical protein
MARSREDVIKLLHADVCMAGDTVLSISWYKERLHLIYVDRSEPKPGVFHTVFKIVYGERVQVGRVRSVYHCVKDESGGVVTPQIPKEG